LNWSEGPRSHSKPALLRAGRFGVPVSFVAMVVLGVRDEHAFAIFGVWAAMTLMLFWVINYRCPKCGLSWSGEGIVGPGDLPSLVAQAFLGSKCRHCGEDLMSS